MKYYTVKIALFLILFAGIGAYSYAETIFTTSIGVNRLYERYLDEENGRDLNGVFFDLTVNNYPGKSRIGWYVKTIIGTQNGGIEWQGESIRSSTSYSSTDIRLSLGPSFTLRPGSKIQIPISIGPVASNYREENYSYGGHDYYTNSEYDYGYSDLGYYEALGVGALADVSIVLVPRRQFALITGITASYDFLRWEKGISETSFRKINLGNFNKINYSGIKVGLYFGLGFRFDNSKSGE